MQTLRDTDQLENTIVIYMSDHGEMLGDHGLILKGCRIFDGLVRVPLLMSWPGQFQTGLRSDALVETVDAAPTLMDACRPPRYVNYEILCARPRIAQQFCSGTNISSDVGCLSSVPDQELRSNFALAPTFRRMSAFMAGS